MNTDTINNFFLIGSLLIAVSVLLSPLSSRLGVPILLVFLVVGIFAGVDGIGQIQFDNYPLAYLVSNLALAIILLDGGMRTRVMSFRVALWPALSLATIGVAITTVLTGIMAIWLFNLSWIQGLLLGAIVGSTDAAVVFSLLKGRSINERVGATLEIESGSNDPMAVFLTVTLIGLLTSASSEHSIGMFLTHFVAHFSIGIALGLGGGWLLWQTINRFQLDEGLYAILALSGGLVIYALSSSLGGSGILSIYLTGVVIGNKPTRGRHSILNVLDGMTWICQIVMFLVLGLLLTPSDLIDLIVPGFLLAFGIILISRPIAVWTSLLPFKNFGKRQRWFISWVGLRGAVPIILAVFPMMAGLPNAQLYFNLAFFVVLISLTVQGSSLAYAAKVAKVELPPKPVPSSRSGIEVYPKSEWEIFVYRLGAQKWCIGEPLRSLSMPTDTKVVALFRKQKMLNTTGRVSLKVDDILCVLGKEESLNALSELFSQAPETKESQDPTRFLGDFFIDPSIKLIDLAPLYAIELDTEHQDWEVKDLFNSKIGSRPVIGDQFRWKTLRWVVAEVVDDNIISVGIQLPKQ
ncbi:potassium/proton antiporter [Parashewanella spongiae]|uniref:Potassium/proton antiporter n=1 Tax=Parashewanella spongiae TaxID=342950 RepID=A0A3A6UGQ9_9GAMM|nr:potassium/proton antiporter [Parashewanella spongiae]MCL1077651.1 potassium/proton antiporter [Parashewanella spongiae]RJY18122.1 potassium/proton antiporter [Parashewanella spongiae]